MSKVARLVEFSLLTRVIVEENATEDQIIKAIKVPQSNPELLFFDVRFDVLI